MPFCPQCGVDNPASARFCDQCGAVLIPVPARGAAPAVPPASTPAPVPAPTPAPAPAAGAPPASAGPSTCPQCGTAVIPGEAFCDTCGAALLGPTRPAPAAPAPGLPFGGVPAQPSYPAPLPVAPAPQPIVTPPIVTPPAPPAPAPAPPPPLRAVLMPARLVVQASGAAIALPATAQALVGRSDAMSSFIADVDLTPLGALDQGVGRRHVRLFVQGGQVFAEDQDSTNGTFLNGTRLAPRQPAPLKSGDELRLGNLALRVEL